MESPCEFHNRRKYWHVLLLLTVAGLSTETTQAFLVTGPAHLFTKKTGANHARTIAVDTTIFFSQRNCCQRLLALHEEADRDVSTPPGTDPNFAESAMRVEEDDVEYDNDDKENESLAAMSKARWKKNVYLDLKNVSRRLQRKDPNVASHAELAVRRMEQWSERLVDSSSPETITSQLRLQAYNLWIHAIAKSYEPLEQRGVVAEQVLRELQHNTSNLFLRLTNVASYTSVMDAYAQQARVDPEAPVQAERILFEWIQETETHVDHESTTSSVTCDTVLNAWAQQGTWKGAARAQEILERLELLAVQQQPSSIRPSEHSYATVCSAWANSRGGQAAAEKALALLSRMLQPKSLVRPDSVVFNAVLHALATSGDAEAGTKAVGLLKQMQELSLQPEYDNCRPDLITYNTVLSCFGHSGHIHAAVKAEQILQGMIDAHNQNPETAPAANTVSYNNVLNSWSKSKLDGAAERAQQLLEYMMRSQQPEIAPDVYSFTSVLDCLAKSKEPDKAVRARKLLDNLLDLNESSRGAQLSQVPFNVVLNAAAFSAMGTSETEKRNALQVAVQTFALMRSKGYPPDMISYGNLLKAFANLMPPGPARTKMALRVFESCCDDGYVGDLVWKEARRAIPTNELNRALPKQLQGRPVEVRDLPRAWKRNQRAKKSSVQKYKPIRSTKKQGSGKQSPKPSASRQLRNISETSWQSGRDM